MNHVDPSLYKSINETTSTSQACLTNKTSKDPHTTFFDH